MRRPLPVGLRPSAFTLVELLVVVGIIALLIGILIPTVRKMRIASQEADTRNLVNQIDQACQAYYLDATAYPGPFSNTMLDAALQSTAMPLYPTATSTVPFNDNTATFSAVPTPPMFEAQGTDPALKGRLTSSENLVLGLCGGLQKTNVAPIRYYYDSTEVGQGAVSFNPLRVGRGKIYMPATNLSTGRRLIPDSALVLGVDSLVPEFLDRFSSPQPILYMRSQRQGVSTQTPAGESLVIANSAATADYNLVEIHPYTKYLLPSAPANGLGKADPTRTIYKDNKITGVVYEYPYDAYDYFVDPASYDRSKTTLTAADVAGKRTRKKDSYVLISAGRDGIYGTDDDITNFGAVKPE